LSHLKGPAVIGDSIAADQQILSCLKLGNYLLGFVARSCNNELTGLVLPDDVAHSPGPVPGSSTQLLRRLHYVLQTSR